MKNVKPWLFLDASQVPSSWPVAECSFDVVYNCNTIHIAPIAVMEGMVSGHILKIIRNKPKI